MQKQTNPKPSGAPMAKMILVVAIIVSLGALFGAVGYLMNNKAIDIKIPATPNAKCSICKGEFVEQCVKCKELNWLNMSENTPLLENEVSACMQECYKTNFPFTTGCSNIRSKCEEFGISGLNEEKDETMDWKTYRNEEYGFEVKYPADWLKNEVDLFPDYMKEAVISSPSHTFFIPQAKRIPEDVWVSISTYPCKTSSCDPREEIEEPYRKTIKQSTIKGQSIFVFNNSFEGERDLNYIIVNNEKTQQVCLTLAIHHGRQNGTEYLSDEEIQPELETFNQILSTFKFIEKETN